MARHEVTPQLCRAIKTIRQNKKISAKFLAESIKKSQSYVSKLEKGEIKTIQDEELKRIWSILFPEQAENISSVEVLETILRVEESQTIPTQLGNEEWFYNFDTVDRLIPIPSEMIDDLVVRMNALSITTEDLVYRVNLNEDIEEEFHKIASLQDGYWHSVGNNDEKKHLIIFMHLEVPQIRKIIQKEQIKSNYVTMLAIVYYLMKIEKNLPAGVDDETWNSAYSYLSKYKFYSIAEKHNLMQQVKTKEEYDSLLSSFELENRKVINEILEAFQTLSSIDIDYVNKSLTAFSKNLEWDSGFMLRVISLPFNEFENMSFTVRKNMLNDIKNIIQKYRELPVSKSKFEQYD